MSQFFVDREDDLSFLEEKFEARGAQLIIIYGRRRIGKTELLLRFVEDKDYVYFLCEKTSMEANISGLARRMSEYLGRRELFQNKLHRLGGSIQGVSRVEERQQEGCHNSR